MPSEETGKEMLMLEVLAAFANGKGISSEAQGRLEDAGLVVRIPAITVAGRTALEDHGKAPADWAREE